MVEWLLNLLQTQFSEHGYLIIFIAMVLENASGIGSLIPGDTLLILAGFYTRGTDINIIWLIVAGIVGAVIGDNISYFVGRKGGRRLLQGLERRWKSLHRRLEGAQSYFKHHGGKTVLFGRNVALVRTYVPLMAGVGKMPYFKFFIYNIIGAALQITAFLLVGYFFGQYRDIIEKVVRRGGIALILIVAIVVYFLHRRRKSRPDRTGRDGGGK